MYRNVATVAVVNFRDIWGNKEHNLKAIADYTRIAAARGANFIVFPEMALNGYSNQADVPRSEKMQRKTAELVPGPSSRAIAELSQKYNMYIVVGMSEQDPDQDKVYNAALVCGPEGIVGCYRKLHPGLQESCWCDKGDEPFLFETEWGPVGVGICYDTFSFPEMVRYYAAKGARLYLSPTCVIRNNFDWHSIYQITQKSAVVANEIFVATANLTGDEFIDLGEGGCELLAAPMESDFAGASVILGPSLDKRVILYAGEWDNREPGVFIADLDLSMALRTLYKVNPITGTPDFRPKIYEKMSRELVKDPYWQKSD